MSEHPHYLCIFTSWSLPISESKKKDQKNQVNPNLRKATKIQKKPKDEKQTIYPHPGQKDPHDRYKAVFLPLIGADTTNKNAGQKIADEFTKNRSKEKQNQKQQTTKN